MLLRRRRARLLGQGLDDADRGDIRRDLLLRRSRPDRVLGQNAEVLPRPLALARLLPLYSFT